MEGKDYPTLVHCDSNDTLVCVVSGRKAVTLLPATKFVELSPANMDSFVGNCKVLSSVPHFQIPYSLVDTSY
jgi:hypothetical protein